MHATQKLFRVVFIYALFFIVAISYTQKLEAFELQLKNVEAQLEAGHGEFLATRLHLSSPPLKTEIVNMDYQLFYNEEELVFENHDQRFQLNSGNFARLFKDGRFLLKEGQFSISTGKSLIFQAERVDLDLAKSQQVLVGLDLRCEPDETRGGFGEDVVKLCLKRGELKLKRITLSESLKDVALKSRTPEMLTHAPMDAAFLSPKIRDIRLKVEKKDFLLNFVAKFIFRFPITVKGDADFIEDKNRVMIHIDDARWWKIGLKRFLLKWLSKVDAEGLSVRGDRIFLDL